MAKEGVQNLSTHKIAKEAGGICGYDLSLF
ncbi:hypothetical protein QAA57_01355 [Glaesserella parasuis]|nr:hypothetical protein [Glaesserella parasuis]MDG6356289.1 hypothetical protein [Glaesserella parasuis]